MIVQREAIWTALQALLNNVTFTATSGANPMTTWAVQEDGTTKVGRRLKLWSDVPLQPACFLVGHTEEDNYTSEVTPSKTTITGMLYVYFKTSDPTCVPTIDMNNILDGIDAAIGPSPVTGKQTLGGLVSHCRRDGKVMLDPGDLDGQGLAIIPIKILVP